MAAYGHADVSEAILRFALRRLPARYTNWRAGAVLVAAADLFRLTRDRARASTAGHAGARDGPAPPRASARARGPGLLDREPFSSDVASAGSSGSTDRRSVWQGLLAIGTCLGAPRTTDGSRRAPIAARTGSGSALRQPSRVATRRSADGSLFVPAALLDGARPFAGDRVARRVVLEPRDAVRPRVRAVRSGRADGARHLAVHAAATARCCSGSSAPRPAACTAASRTPPRAVDQVYGVNVARFLADADLPDQLVLSLYGTLAGAMTRDTFVSGEAATVAPLRAAAARVDVPAAERRHEHRVPRDAAARARPRAPRPRGAPSGLELALSPLRGPG